MALIIHLFTTTTAMHVLKTYLVVFLLGCSGLAMGQRNSQKFKKQPKDEGTLRVQLGGSVNYYLGPGSESFDNFSNDYLNWQLDGLVGLKLVEGRDNRRTYLGVYGGAGFLNRATINAMLQDQNLTLVNETEQRRYNLNYQWEVGILVAEMLRISTGSGTQYFQSQMITDGTGNPTERDHLNYYSSTAGVQLKLGVIAWTINCNFLYGKDLDKTIIRPSTGLVLKF